MLETIITATFVSSLLLGLFSALGTIWINRAREIDRITYEKQINEVKSQLEFVSHANRSIFSKEFVACEDSWRILLKFKTETLGLERDSSNTQAFQLQLQACRKRHVETHDILYSSAPFIPENIRDGMFLVANSLQNLYVESAKILEDIDATELFDRIYTEKCRGVDESILSLERMIRRRFVSPSLMTVIERNAIQQNGDV